MASREDLSRTVRVAAAHPRARIVRRALLPGAVLALTVWLWANTPGRDPAILILGPATAVIAWAVTRERGEWTAAKLRLKTRIRRMLRR